MSEAFRVLITVEIEKVDEHGAFRGERLSTREHLVIPLDSFTEIAATLGRFHELAQQIKTERTTP